MKFLSTFLLFWSVFYLSYAQGSIPPSFFEGKSVVLVSVDPSARPVFNWQTLADSIHPSLIEAGGMGKVYEAEERLSKRRVALKVLRSELSRSEAGRVRPDSLLSKRARRCS